MMFFVDFRPSGNLNLLKLSEPKNSMKGNMIFRYGIILTSITGSYYANVYKWKERQTFDFLVRNIKSGTCDLLCRKQGELMIFARNAPYRADIPFENER